MSRAVTYARQSKVNEDGSEGSPEVQRRLTRHLVAARGWTHAGHYEDVGVSGYDPKVARPGFDAALAAIEAGDADTLVVWRLDRLTRKGVSDAVAIVDRLRAAGAALVTVENNVDTTTPMGVGLFAMFAALAEQESANISTRTSTTFAVLREAGSHLTGRTPYGTRAERVTVTTPDGKPLSIRRLVPEPAEAAVLVEACDRAVEGEAIRAIADDLTGRGVRTRAGATFNASTLLRALRAPQLAGYAPQPRKRGEQQKTDDAGRVLIARGADGERLRPWEPVIPEDLWHRTQAALDARVVTRGLTKAPSLLGGSGLLFCECGSAMYAHRRAGRDGVYACASNRSGRAVRACRGVTVAMTHAEDYLARRVLSRLSGLDPEASPADAALLAEVTRRFAATTDGSDRAGRRASLSATVRDTSDALQRLDDDRARGLFDGALGGQRYERQVRALSAPYDDTVAALDALDGEDLSAGLSPFLDAALLAGDDGDPLGPGGFWDSLDIGGRRAFLGLFLDRVEAVKSTRHGGGNSTFRGDERLLLAWSA